MSTVAQETHSTAKAIANRPSQYPTKHPRVPKTMAAPEKCPRAQVSTAKIAARTVMEPNSMEKTSVWIRVDS